MNDTPQLTTKLDAYYRQVSDVILARQHPVTGLLPASTAVNAHGDYRDAWVRDNVYSILAVWGLALAYRKLDDDGGRGFELEQAVVKLMRGLLFAMMRQAKKVEAFKMTQDPLASLHAKYDTATGDTVIADHAWGHLQLDATSLYLLMLAQMTASGLTIIYALDEVNFVQNLVFYIGRAYRTPDYGIWERGDKTNHGQPELNASSVALAKAALEALSGFDLFGVRGSQASVIHVLPDEVARARVTLEAFLPRESSSKETDAALLSAISFPAFAVEDEALIERTRAAILTKLGGRYGLKRFLRDGHQTALETTERLHYEPQELQKFEHVESEWPLFFSYLVLDGIFFDRPEQVSEYRAKLKEVAVERDGYALLPELYYVPAEAISAERAAPGSQARLPNANVPLVWAQSLYWLGELLNDKLISVYDVDPLGRHNRLDKTARPVVQIALLAEDETVQEELAAQGVRTQTPEQIQPVELYSATELAEAYYQIGRNDKLGLTGRPVRRLLTLSSSRVFRLAGEWAVCPPAFFDQREFYLSLDPAFLVTRFKAELAYLHRTWFYVGRPTMTLVLSRTLLENGEGALYELMSELRGGTCAGVPVKLAPLNLLLQTANVERIDNLHDFAFADAAAAAARTPPRRLAYDPDATRLLTPDEELALELGGGLGLFRHRLAVSQNLFEHVEVLTLCAKHFGLDFDLDLELGASGANPDAADAADDPPAEASGRDTVRVLLEEVYEVAGELRLWAVVRRAAGLLNKVDVALSDSVTDILVRQKSLLIGKAYSERSLITKPLPQAALLEKIAEFCREDIRDRVLTQELIIYLGLLIRAEPELFRGLSSVRVGYLVLLLVSDLALELGVTQDEGYECLMQLSPAEVQGRLREVLLKYGDKEQVLKHQELIQVERSGDELVYTLDAVPPAEPEGGWWRWRRREGILSRIPGGFYEGVWQLMTHCRGLIIGDKLERRNRLASHTLLAEMTPGEKKFALQVDHLLNKIPSPEYRQLNIETLTILARVLAQNAAFKVDDYLVLDVIIGHAVRLAYLNHHPEREPHYDADKAEAWAAFYELPPQATSGYLVTSFKYLLESRPDYA